MKIKFGTRVKDSCIFVAPAHCQNLERAFPFSGIFECRNFVIKTTRFFVASISTSVSFGAREPTV